MKWHKLENQEPIGNEQKYLELTNEAIEEFRRSLIQGGLVTEADNKFINWAMENVKKICPSPEKIRDFFAKFGAKIDKSMQSGKSPTLSKAWNTLKSMVQGLDGKEVTTEEAKARQKIKEGMITPEEWLAEIGAV